MAGDFLMVVLSDTSRALVNRFGFGEGQREGLTPMDIPTTTSIGLMQCVWTLPVSVNIKEE